MYMNTNIQGDFQICINVPLKQTLKISFTGFRSGGPLLFLLYVNNLHESSALVSIMFADDMNFFYGHKGLKTLVSLVNQELQKTNGCLRLINSREDDLPVLLRKLLIKKHNVKRVKSIKYLGVLLNQKYIFERSLLKTRSQKILVYNKGLNHFWIKNRYLQYTIRYYLYIHTYLNIQIHLGAVQANKSKKASQSPKACNRNYQQQNTL